MGAPKEVDVSTGMTSIPSIHTELPGYLRPRIRHGLLQMGLMIGSSCGAIIGSTGSIASAGDAFGVRGGTPLGPSAGWGAHAGNSRMTPVPERHPGVLDAAE